VYYIKEFPNTREYIPSGIRKSLRFCFLQGVELKKTAGPLTDFHSLVLIVSANHPNFHPNSLTQTYISVLTGTNKQRTSPAPFGLPMAERYKGGAGV